MYQYHGTGCDTIEGHNVSNQMYLFQEIGSPKTTALLKLAQLLSAVTIRFGPSDTEDSRSREQ
jgi:hypothetical protein